MVPSRWARPRSGRAGTSDTNSSQARPSRAKKSGDGGAIGWGSVTPVHEAVM
jgi:hypothetical protein